MAIRFPKRRADGSFDVLVRLCNVDGSNAAVRSWIADWGQKNEVWDRVWDGATRTVERLHLAEEFAEPPAFEQLSAGQLLVRLRSRADARLWKDWMAKFVDDFCAAHPGTSFLGAESPTEE